MNNSLNINDVLRTVDDPTADDALGRVLADGYGRDMVIIMATGDTDRDTLVRIALNADGHMGRTVGRILSDRLLGAAGVDWTRLDAWTTRLERMPGSAGAQATLAYLHWIDGRETEAVRAAEQATRMDPAMSLPGLVLQLVAEDVRPIAERNGK